MKQFKNYITELFDHPYAANHNIPKTQGRNIEYIYDIPKTDATKSFIKISFSHMSAHSSIWEVSFSVDGMINKTGKGDAPKVFATVLDALRRFAKKYKPSQISFTADKSTNITDGSRVSLYRAMIARFAPQFGYELKREGQMGYNGVYNEILFVIQRKGFVET